MRGENLKIIMVRHGETDWNSQGRKQGHAETRLNSTGLVQAMQLAEQLKSRRVDEIFSSDLPRAMETAKEINRFHNLKIEESKLLREIDLGRCNGMTSGEMRKNFAEWGKLKDANPERTPYPDGESHIDVQTRVKEFLNQLIKKNIETALIVSHQGFNRNFVQVLTDKTYRELKNMDFHHNVIYEFDTKSKKLSQTKI